MVTTTLPLSDVLVALPARIDTIAAEERAASLAKRSIKKESKLFALDLAIRCMDLTTLEGADTPGKVHSLCLKAMHPVPHDTGIPAVAAVCVYPSMVSHAKECLKGSNVRVASVGAFLLE